MPVFLCSMSSTPLIVELSGDLPVLLACVMHLMVAAAESDSEYLYW